MEGSARAVLGWTNGDEAWRLWGIKELMRFGGLEVRLEMEIRERGRSKK